MSSTDDSLDERGDEEFTDPLEHMEWAMSVLSDHRKPWAELSAKQLACIEFISEDPEQWRLSVVCKLNMWESDCSRWAECLQNFKQNLSVEQLGTIGKVDPFSLNSMVKASGTLDQQYVEDFLEGFPVTGVVSAQGTGYLIRGGQYTHGRPAHGVVPNLEHLRSRCMEINSKTIRRAQARVPGTEDENKLAWATWEKVLSDTEKGRLGEPMDISDFPMHDGLLVDTFGIWERHGSSTQDSLRIIHNFKANQANEFAYMPEKLSYNGFGELKQTCAEFRSRCVRKLRMGKADFKSAFKTLAPAESQRWLCYALIYNPERRCLQVIRLLTQAFGSLGGVVAWYRTAKLIQCIMLELFDIVVFVYVDDFFWVIPDGAESDSDYAAFVMSAFKRVVTGLLGWELDAEKEHVGDDMSLLGIQVSLEAESSTWKFNLPMFLKIGEFRNRKKKLRRC